MLITRKNFLLCLLLCATFGLSLVFGTNHTNIRVPEPQVRNESPFTPTFLSQQNTNQDSVTSWLWHEYIDIHKLFSQQLKLYQVKVYTHLTSQHFVFLTIKTSLTWLEKFTLLTYFSIGKPHQLSLL